MLGSDELIEMLRMDDQQFEKSGGEQADEVISRWFEAAKQGQISWTEVGERLLGFKQSIGSMDRPDTDRARRCGFGEVIYGAGKSPQTVVEIAQRLLAGGSTEVLATRINADYLPTINRHVAHSRYDCLARTLRMSDSPIAAVRNRPCETQRSMQVEGVMVVTAGSTDLPVAREALETLRWMGVNADLVADVGVAGPYRLLPHLARLRACRALVVCAGFEGALASVVGGLVSCPIIAVPTSVGYGANLAGITTLLSMITSCAAGVSVVNIDAGFKGGYIAGLIATRSEHAWVA